MKIIVIISVLIVSSIYDVNGRESRIIGGKLAKEEQFPFAAHIIVETASLRFVCGGALISDEWVLTSAVCTSGIVNVLVHLGSITREGEDPNRVTLGVSDLVAHPKFDEKTLANDIGLMKLKAPVTFSDNIQPIKLTTLNLPNILNPIAVGWGDTSDASPNYPNELSYVQLNILSNDVCKLTYGNQIIDTMVCLAGEQNEGTCFGDGGSPLVVRPLGTSSLQHVGVSSFFSSGGCESTDPSGFTRTYPYVSWIKSETGIA